MRSLCLAQSSALAECRVSVQEVEPLNCRQRFLRFICATKTENHRMTYLYELRVGNQKHPRYLVKLELQGSTFFWIRKRGWGTFMKQDL